MNQKIEDYLIKLEEKLINGNWKMFEFSKEWLATFETEAGVYAIREEGEICYVGETGSVRKRMRDLLDTRNHSLRRTIGKVKFSNEDGYAAGTASKRFPLRFEEELNRIFEDNFEVSAVAVAIGRKELEERLVEKFEPVYNTRKKRVSEKSYSVSEKRETHKNAYRPWNKAEETKIVKLAEEGKSASDIGEIVCRNKGAITSRLKKIRERS